MFKWYYFRNINAFVLLPTDWAADADAAGCGCAFATFSKTSIILTYCAHTRTLISLSLSLWPHPRHLLFVSSLLSLSHFGCRIFALSVARFCFQLFAVDPSMHTFLLSFVSFRNLISTPNKTFNPHSTFFSFLLLVLSLYRLTRVFTVYNLFRSALSDAFKSLASAHLVSRASSLCCYIPSILWQFTL